MWQEGKRSSTGGASFRPSHRFPIRPAELGRNRRAISCRQRMLRRPSRLSSLFFRSSILHQLDFRRTMAALPKASEKPKLVAVIGTTGVGKTDLGVELAKALQTRERAPFEGEVVNHDSMQCYRGLDVITNKATTEEMQGVPHHLMGFLEPGEEWSVNEFLRDALDKVRCRAFFSSNCASDN